MQIVKGSKASGTWKVSELNILNHGVGNSSWFCLSSASRCRGSGLVRWPVLGFQWMVPWGFTEICLVGRWRVGWNGCPRYRAEISEASVLIVSRIKRISYRVVRHFVSLGRKCRFYFLLIAASVWQHVKLRLRIWCWNWVAQRNHFAPCIIRRNGVVHGAKWFFIFLRNEERK